MCVCVCVSMSCFSNLHIIHMRNNSSNACHSHPLPVSHSVHSLTQYWLLLPSTLARLAIAYHFFKPLRIHTRHYKGTRGTYQFNIIVLHTVTTRTISYQAPVNSKMLMHEARYSVLFISLVDLLMHSLGLTIWENIQLSGWSLPSVGPILPSQSIRVSYLLLTGCYNRTP